MTQENLLTGNEELQPHPVFGHRGGRIIGSLLADRWFNHA